MSYLTEQKTKLKQAQVVEALLRMKKLNLLSDVVRQFKEDGKIMKSENFRLFGYAENRIAIIYDLTKDEEEMIRAWEKETGNVVYHTIKNTFEFGTCYSFLYVSKYPEEWEYDNDDLEQGCPLVYVKNVTCDNDSEYGSIGVKPSIGGVLREA